VSHTLRTHWTSRSAVLREVGRRIKARTTGLWLRSVVTVELGSRWTILAPLNNTQSINKSTRYPVDGVTHTALQGTSVDVVAVELANGHGGILVRVHFEEGKAPVRLQACFDDIAKVLKDWNQVLLGGVRRQIADIARCLPLRSLGHHHVIALNAMSREMMMAERSGGSHAHGGHGLLLGDGRLALLVGPVAPDGTRAKPFAIHGAEGFLSITTVAEGNEPVSSGSARLHVPHHAGLRHRPEGREGLEQNFIVDFVAQITNEDVEMVGCVFFVVAVGLIGPVDSDFLIMCQATLNSNMATSTYRLVDPTPVEGRHGSLSSARVVVLDETVIQTFALELESREDQRSRRVAGEMQVTGERTGWFQTPGGYWGRSGGMVAR
jgi:hypothetical protein